MHRLQQVTWKGCATDKQLGQGVSHTTADQGQDPGHWGAIPRERSEADPQLSVGVMAEAHNCVDVVEEEPGSIDLRNHLVRRWITRRTCNEYSMQS